MEGQRIARPGEVFQQRQTPDYTRIWHLLGGANPRDKVCLVDADGNLRSVAVVDQDLRADVANLVEAFESACEDTNDYGYKREQFPNGIEGLIEWHLGLDHAALGEWPEQEAQFESYRRLKQWSEGAS